MNPTVQIERKGEMKGGGGGCLCCVEKEKKNSNNSNRLNASLCAHSFHKF